MIGFASFETFSMSADYAVGSSCANVGIEELAEIMGHVALGDPTAQHVPRGDLPLFTRVVPMLCSLPHPKRVRIDRDMARSEDIGDICLQKFVKNDTLLNTDARSLDAIQRQM